MSSLLAGIFVGGRSSRMGGRPKGLLAAPDGAATLVERWRKVLDSLGIPAMLVGRHAAYAEAGLPVLDDAVPEIGPLGGLVALLDAAGDRHALALAVDMPHVPVALVQRLVDARGLGPAVAPRFDGHWEPLFSIHHAPTMTPIARAQLAGGQHSIARLLDAAGAVPFPMTIDERALLRDWDTPEDVRRDVP